MWTEHKPAVDRSIEIWWNMKIMEFSLKYPSNKKVWDSGEVLVDKLLIAKLVFFSYFADILKPFLMAYQDDKLT